MSIVFSRIYINNFLSIREAAVDLTDQGFVLVSGRNEKTVVPQSNGSGKSTIFDAIFWALTGETLRGTSDIINENFKKDGCMCCLEFTDDQHSYMIKRAKGHITLGNSCYFYIDNEVVSDQIKKSQEMIEKQLPFVASPEILGSIILLGQGLPFKFSSFSPTKRKDVLEIMSGATSEVDRLKYQLSIKESEVKSKSDELAQKIFETSSKLSRYEGVVNALTSQLEDTENKDLSEEIKRREEQIVNCQTALEDFVEKPELSDELMQLDQKLEKLRQLTAQTSASLNLVSQQIRSLLVGNCPTCGRPYDTDEEHVRLRETLQNKSQEMEKTLKDFQTQQTDLSNRRFEVSEEISTRKNMTSTLNYQIQVARSQLVELQKYETTIKNIKEKIDQNEKEIKVLKVELNDFNKENENLKNILECIGYLNRQLSRDFKGYVLEDAIKFMASRAKKYGRYMFSDSEIDIQLSGNKINILVGSRQYENLSGGERQRADLAVQFALRDMLSVSSGFSCNLLVLDEAFDNLDAQGSSALINLLTMEFTDIDSVFVITHHSEIDIPYDKQILVTKKFDGNSYID